VAVHDHPAYDDAVRYAVKRVQNEGGSWALWYDRRHIFVRGAGDPPPNAVLACLAQKLDHKTVQLQFAGGHRELIEI